MFHARAPMGRQRAPSADLACDLAGLAHAAVAAYEENVASAK